MFQQIQYHTLTTTSRTPTAATIFQTVVQHLKHYTQQILISLVKRIAILATITISRFASSSRITAQRAVVFSGFPTTQPCKR